MRIRQVLVVFVVAVACTPAFSGVATACKVCDPFLHCITQSPGALTCVEGPATCAMFLQCVGGSRKVPDGGVEFLTTWSLFEAAAGAALPAPDASVQNEAGDITLGEEARTSAGPGPAGSLLGLGALVDAALAFGESFALSFVDDAGDGFAIQRSPEGGRVRLEVREVTGDVPGRVLASEPLGPRDRLTVPVRAEGRDRVLLLQAASESGGGGPFEVARLRRALAATARVLPPRREPLLHAHAR
jgi:hypothetical protein